VSLSPEILYAAVRRGSLAPRAPAPHWPSPFRILSFFTSGFYFFFFFLVFFFLPVSFSVFFVFKKDLEF
jgi:hypothetical protein